MQFAIYNLSFKADHWSVYERVFSFLDHHEVRYCINQQLAISLEKNQKQVNYSCLYDEEVPNDVSAMICLGGDGTILHAITLTVDKDLPILGINLGQLGFMAEVVSDELEKALELLINDNYIIDERSLVELESESKIFGSKNFGLNEFTISKRDTSSIIKIKTFLNGELLTTYWADGLIISTPTGSTGYNLSCGGPIIFPNSSNFVITPIAPHHLNVRPVVVPDSYIISFQLSGRADTALCTLDSRNAIIDINENLGIRKKKKTAKLMRMPETNFLQILHSKLLWGDDNRNKLL